MSANGYHPPTSVSNASLKKLAPRKIYETEICKNMSRLVRTLCAPLWKTHRRRFEHVWSIRSLRVQTTLYLIIAFLRFCQGTVGVMVKKGHSHLRVLGSNPGSRNFWTLHFLFSSLSFFANANKTKLLGRKRPWLLENV